MNEQYPDLHEERVEHWGRPRIKVRGQPTANNGWLYNDSAQVQLLCSGVGIALHYVITGGTSGCTGEPTCMLCVNFWIVVLYV